MGQILTLLFAAVSLLVDIRADGFVIPSHTNSPPPTSALVIAAKKGANTSKQRKPAAAGFGDGSSKDKVDAENDFASFPSLEKRVRDTLVAAASNDALSSLTPEIYQRLDQIYGFPCFNYATFQEEASTSLGDMLTIDGASSASSSDDLLNPEGERFAIAPPTESIDCSSSLGRLPPFAQIRALHVDPLVLAIDNFFSSDECDRYVKASENKANKSVLQSRSPTVGKDANAKAQRTSTTFYHMYKNVPELICKASRLLGIDRVDRWEEPQTVQYRRNERFTWHLDALGPTEQLDSPAGQRIATLLVYLTDVRAEDGGATLFRDLGGGADEKYLRVQPAKGTALLFFPSAGGIPGCPFDIRTLHSGEVVAADAANDKWIAQLWLRQWEYQPTAPPGNRYSEAADAITGYCSQNAVT